MATRGLISLFITPCNLFHINPSHVLIPNPRARVKNYRERECRCRFTEAMADENLPNQLPLDWVLDSKKKKDGIEVMFHTNVSTGQKFSTKEDLFQYINYTTTTLPLLNAGWTMNLEGKLQPPGEGVMHKAVGESSSSAPDAQLKGQPVLETEKKEERSTSKPGSKKYKRKNKRQDSK